MISRTHKPEPPDTEDTLKYFAIVLLAACAATLFPSTTDAQDNPINLALVAPLQIVPETESVSAFRLSLIYGANANMKGFDWSLASKTTGNFTGVQWAAVGLVDKDFEGWQSAFVGITQGTVTGFQGPFSVYNSAGDLHGIQIGLVNNTQTIKGIQVGLINLIKEGGFMPIFPIVNWGGL
jgi:hypothetical protein